jgi:prevent-host-death family protein
VPSSSPARRPGSPGRTQPHAGATDDSNGAAAEPAEAASTVSAGQPDSAAPAAQVPRWAGTWPLRLPPPTPATAPDTASNIAPETVSDTPPAGPSADSPAAAALLPGPATTMHQARSALPQLINAATQGTSTPLARGAHHALLTNLAEAAALGWNLFAAPSLGTADARKKLGDMIQAAAEGSPQILCRHNTPVAVLIPATPAGTPLPAPTPPSAAAHRELPDPATGPAGAVQAAVPTPDTAAVQAAPAPVAATGPAPAAVPTPPAGRQVQQPAPAPWDPPATADSTTAVPAAPAAAAPSGPPRPAAPNAAGASATASAPPAAATTPAVQAPAPATSPLAIPGETTAAAVRTPRRLVTLGQALDGILATTAASGQPAVSAPPGLSTGIRDLDDALGGLQPGRFYLVAAAPGAGSSLIATSAARTTALDGHQAVLYAACGLSHQDVTARVIAAHLPVDYRNLRSGRLTAAEQEDVAVLHGQLAAAPLYIDDGSDLTAAAITESVPDIPDLVLVVVDRLQTTEDPHLPLSGAARITDAAQALAHLARTRGIPVLAAIDTDDPRLLAHLALDVTVTLARAADQIHVTVTERDLGLQTTLILHADLAHARITDPPAPRRYTGVPNALADTRPPSAPSPAAVPPAAPSTAAALDPDTGNTAGPTGAAPPAEPADGPAAPRHSSHRAATTRPSTTEPTAAGTARDYSYFTAMIARAVDEALHEHGGDTEAATGALIKKAVPNAMALFEATRVGANYEHTVYPETLEFLRKKTKDGADDIWEGRHNWTNTHLMDTLQAGTHPPVTVDALDTNASFLSAFKTYLPIGALIHDPDGGFKPKRSGIYHFPTRPAWNHPDLPDPIGNRHEEGPVLLDDATVRLLIRCAKLGLAEAPHISECWTSGASEGLLEKFRRILTQAREDAIKADDAVTVEYVKAMYSKFISTLGESSVNRDIRRPDWMHIVRSQAFANLWHKAHRAHQSGLTVVRVRGTDELHVTGGDWRSVFVEGRLATQMKQKDQYPLPRKSAR